jgi:hypothetical protein
MDGWQERTFSTGTLAGGQSGAPPGASEASRMARRRTLLRLLSLAVGLLTANRAAAFELWDDRLQIHGYFETQVRAIARDFDASDGWDLTQWAWVLDLEVEADLLPDGWGPFDLVTGFGRAEVRYDCVWNRACWLSSSANAFGDRARRLPKRLSHGRRDGYVGNVFVGDLRRYHGEPLETMSIRFRDRPDEAAKPYPIDRTEAFYILFTSPGPDQLLGTADDPSPFYFERYYKPGKCRFSARRTKGFTDAVGLFNLGPLDPACFIEPIGAFIDKPNPFRAGDFNPITGTGGGLALPYRPAPELAFDAPAPSDRARGVWLPNAETARLLHKQAIDDAEINFRQAELAWNRGASQQDEKELRELYLDLDGALSQPGSVQSPGPGALLSAELRRVANCPVGRARDLVVLRCGSPRGSATGDGGQLRRLPVGRSR